LLSVRRICSGGKNRVVFEDGGGYIENVSTGRRTKIVEEGGTYALWLWVLVQDREESKLKQMLKQNPFHAISDPYADCETPDERAAREAAEGLYDWQPDDAQFDSDFAGFTRHAQN